MLQLLKKHQPPTARVMVSKHVDEVGPARQFGADLFIAKSLTEDQKRQLEGDSVRLGLFLHIRQALLDSGCPGLPSVSRHVPVSDSDEMLLQASAAQQCDRLIEAGNDYGRLRELLCRRGWRKRFDFTGYSAAHWNAKVNMLLDFARLSAEYVRTICQAGQPVMERLVSGRARLSDGECAEVHAIDALLSILAFVLELGEYDPPAMATNFARPRFAHRAIEPPPWAGIGLAVYLRERQREGIAESLRWIRNK